MPNKKKKVWIVAVCNTSCDGVVISRVEGTLTEMKKYLIRILKEDKALDRFMWDYGDTSVKAVQVSDDKTELNAFATYHDYHIDYTARLESATEIQKVA